MKKNCVWLLASALFLAGVLSTPEARAAQQEGKALFQQKCTACHTIGKGNLVGPDLKGVTAKRKRSWLIRWISEPDRMMAEGDSIATGLLKEFNNVPMPNMELSSAEAESVVSYLEGPLQKPAAPKKSDSLPAPSQDEIALGRNLFQGKIRFVNDGPSCTSCHHVKNDAVIGGGILAKELTTVFSRMGGEGVRAILGGPPFPVMQIAYKGMPFTDDEIHALVGFLQYADREHAYQQPRDYGWGLFVAGVGGVSVLMGFYSVLGRRRKKRSVNQDIYDRQIKSE